MKMKMLSSSSETKKSCKVSKEKNETDLLCRLLHIQALNEKKKLLLIPNRTHDLKTQVS